MIRYSLTCEHGHDFESWFKDSAAYDQLSELGQITCSICGIPDVRKTVMAPAIGGTGKGDATPVDGPEPLSKPANPAEAMIAQMRDHLQKNSDYVGKEFAQEARRIHDGESDQRSIWGEATAEDAKSLHDDGVPVAPLPFMPRRDD